MGFWNSLKNGVSRAVGFVGNALRKVGDVGQSIAGTIGTYAKPIGDAVGGLVGQFSPVAGDMIKGAGNFLNQFAPKAQQVASQVKGVGTLTNKLVGGGGGGG